MIDYTKLYEIYIGEHNRTYIVTPFNFPDKLMSIAKKRFKVANSRIMVCTAWIIGDDLYLDYPCGKGITAVWVAYIMPKIRRTTYGD